MSRASLTGSILAFARGNGQSFIPLAAAATDIFGRYPSTQKIYTPPLQLLDPCVSLSVNVFSLQLSIPRSQSIR